MKLLAKIGPASPRTQLRAANYGLSIDPADTGSELVRAGAAVDDLLEQLQRQLYGGFLPQRSFLLDALTFDKNVAESVAEFVEDLDSDSDGEDKSLTKAFQSAALSLGQLEDSLGQLLRAVSWSARFSGFNWWLIKRQQELGVDAAVVLPVPGSARDFLIEREPALGRFFSGCSRILDLTAAKLEQLSRIRLLTVPQTDGGSPRWHPITLGHELGHLRFDRVWVARWLAEQRAATFPKDSPARFAIQAAKSEALAAQSWYTELVSWLSECACDTTTMVLYGDEGLRCLDTYLSVHSVAEHTQHHPSPTLRIASLRASDPKQLDEFREGIGTVPSVRDRANAYCQLSTRCREAVRKELESLASGSSASDLTTSTALAAQQANAPPMASSWDVDVVASAPSSIESGLVRSLWREDGQDSANASRMERMRSRSLRDIRVEHAVDFLQFMHLFEVRRTPAEGSDKLTNVLWVKQTGICSRDTVEPGPPAHDVRLGRHFIVFRRNEISTLTTIEAQETWRIQERVEIGWGDEFVLHPSEMVLAVTLEHMIIANDCTAQVLSRSSIGRMGLLSATAVHVQPGFRGCLTLELVNLASVPLKLSPGQRIAQIVPAGVLGEYVEYGGKYQDQDWRPKFSAGSQDWEMPILQSLKEDKVSRSTGTGAKD